MKSFRKTKKKKTTIENQRSLKHFKTWYSTLSITEDQLSEETKNKIEKIKEIEKNSV